MCNTTLAKTLAYLFCPEGESNNSADSGVAHEILTRIPSVAILARMVRKTAITQTGKDHHIFGRVQRRRHRKSAHANASVDDHGTNTNT